MKFNSSLPNFALIKSYLTDLIKSPSKINSVEMIIKSEVRKSSLTLFEPNSYKPFKVQDGLIISLTTYGSNIHSVHFVVRSLLNQSVQASKVVLWLDEDEFTPQNLPISIVTLISSKFEIRYCSNLRSFKKLMPSIVNFPDFDIITVDDDYIYPNDMVEILLREARDNTNTIISHRVHMITFETNGQIRSYNDWEFESTSDEASHKVFVTTGGGTFFPKGVLDDGFLDSEVYMKVCPTADDVWVNLYAMKKGVKRKKVKDLRPWCNRFFPINEDQMSPLSAINVGKNANDTQLNDFVKKFSLDFSAKNI